MSFGLKSRWVFWAWVFLRKCWKKPEVMWIVAKMIIPNLFLPPVPGLTTTNLPTRCRVRARGWSVRPWTGRRWRWRCRWRGSGSRPPRPSRGRRCLWGRPGRGRHEPSRREWTTPAQQHRPVNNCLVEICKNDYYTYKRGSQLSNLWWMPNSVSKGFDTAMRTGSSSRLKWYPTTILFQC